MENNSFLPVNISDHVNSNSNIYKEGNSTYSKDEKSYNPEILFYILGFAIILTNAPIVVAYAVRRAVRRIVGPFLLSLLVADLMVGAVTTPLIVITRVRAQGTSPITCAISNSILYIPLKASVFSILLMAVDRFISIKWALRYYELMTTTASTCLVLVVWTLSTTLAFIPMMTPWQDIPVFSDCSGLYNPYVFRYVISIFLIAVPFLVITILYIYMGALAFRHFKKIQMLPNPQELSYSNTVPCNESVAVDKRKGRGNDNRVTTPDNGNNTEINRTTDGGGQSNNPTTSNETGKRTTKRFKAAYTSGVITIGFGLTWLPFLSMHVVHIHCTSGISCPGITYASFGVGFATTSILFLVHSVCNPIFYIYKNKSLKLHMAAFFRCKGGNAISDADTTCG